MWCPRCEQEGKIHKWRFCSAKETIILWSCDECDTAWEDPHLISPSNFGQDSECLLKEKYNVGPLDLEMTILGHFWLIWYDKITQKFVGKAKLAILFEEPRRYNQNMRLTMTVNIQGISLEVLLDAFDLASKKKDATQNLYTSVLMLNAKKAEIFQRCTDVKIDRDQYYYFVEFDSEVDGKITAESENYPAIFLPRQSEAI